RPMLWQKYSDWFAAFHSSAWEEAVSMARSARKEFKIDLGPLIRHMGPQHALEEVARILSETGLQQKKINLRPIIERFGLESLLESLTDAERKDLQRRLR